MGSTSRQSYCTGVSGKKIQLEGVRFGGNLRLNKSNGVDLRKGNIWDRDLRHESVQVPICFTKGCGFGTGRMYFIAQHFEINAVTLIRSIPSVLAMDASE